MVRSLVRSWSVSALHIHLTGHINTNTTTQTRAGEDRGADRRRGGVGHHAPLQGEWESKEEGSLVVYVVLRHAWCLDEA